MGWSYGGYMTSWIITQTKRFKAASAGAPVTNLMSFNGTADIPGLHSGLFRRAILGSTRTFTAKHSAMFNIKGVTTPTLIQHGEADIRVPISQGYELYNALKAARRADANDCSAAPAARTERTENADRRDAEQSRLV